MTKTKPRPIYIGKTEESAKLYRLEEKRGAVIRETAEEWQRLVGSLSVRDEKVDFWGEAMPQQLFDILEHYGDGAVEAATAFLEMHGFTVTKA